MVEALEPRRLLAGITGNPTAEVGDPYALQLVYGNAGSPWGVDWGDGSSQSVTGGSLVAPTHDYAPGTYAPVATFGGRAHPLGLDPAFGQFGRVIMDLGNWEKVNSVSLVADDSGRLIAAGDSTGNFALVRYLPSGAPDPTFGSGGVVITDFGTSQDKGYSVALQPDGKIVVVGQQAYNWAIARYLPDGALDPSFGAGGKVTADWGAYDVAREVRIQPDGNLLVAGSTSAYWAVASFRPDGSPDPTFGIAGRVKTDVANGLGMAMELLPDGRFVVAGSAQANYYGGVLRLGMIRYLPDGSLDSTFGSGGRAVHDLGPGSDVATDLAALPGGKLVVTRSDDAGGLAVSRFNADGSLDTSFGVGGTARAGAGLAGLARSVLPGPDGSLTVGGEAETYPAFARFTADGTPDPSFGIGGFFQDTWDNANGYGASYSLARRPDGRVVSGGTLWGQFVLHQLLPDNRVVVDYRPPAAPTALQATSAGPNSVDLSWQQPGGPRGIGGFRATLHPLNGGDDVVATFAAGATGGTVSGLAPDTEYGIGLSAVAGAHVTAQTGEDAVVRTDPLLTTLQSPYTQEGAGFAVQLDAHGYAVRKWLLDWGDGIEQVIAPSATSPTTTASHAYADDGNYEVTAGVADEWGAFSAKPVKLEVRDVAATLTATPLVDPTALNPGTAFTIRLDHADPGVLDVPTYAVDWGDGTTTGADPNGITASHVYAAMDRYAIAVTATDPKGVASAAPPLMVGEDVSAPTDLAATGVDATGATFAWADTTGGATATDIEYKLTADKRDVWVRAQTFLPGVTSGRAGVDHPYPEGTFTFRARASSGFATEVSNAVTRTLAGPTIGRPAVVGFSASAVPDDPDDPNDRGGIDVFVPKPNGAPGDVAYEYELVDHAPLDPFLTEWRIVSSLGMGDDGAREGFLHGQVGGRPGVRHTVRLRTWAYGEGGVRVFSPWSDPKDVTAAGKSPPAPNVTATATSPTSVSFGYEAGSYSYQYYAEQLYRGTLAYQYQTNSDGQARPTVTGLKPATTYRFAVRRTQGRQAESAAQFITVTTPPAAVRPPTSPDALTPTQRRGENGYAIDLAWRDTTTPLWSGGSSSDPPDDFVVERAEVGAGGAHGPFAAVGTAGAATPFFTDRTAEPEVAYAYRVRARNAGGLSVDRPENNAGARITVPRLNLFSDVPVAGERAGDPGQFAFERDGDVSGELPIEFDPVDLPAGHNAAPDDYDLSSTDDLKFKAGERFAYLAVTATVDNKPEFPEALSAAVGASSAYEPADGQRPSTRATSGPAVVTIPDVPIDLDVDSDNDNGFEQPDRSAAEDLIENFSSRPGKVIAVNDNDDDGDRIPDFADGYGRFADLPKSNVNSEEKFVPLALELAEDVDRSKAWLRVNYAASDPNGVTRTGNGTNASPYGYFLPPSDQSGLLRLWSKPGDFARSGNSISNSGGTYVGPTGDGHYDGAALNRLDWSGNAATLWIEALTPSSVFGGTAISVSIDPDGAGPEGFSEADVVRLTNFNLDFIDGQAFGPKMLPDGTAKLQNKDFRTASLGGSGVDGAITDGASLVVIRTNPMLPRYFKLDFELREQGTGGAGNPWRVGSVWNAGGALPLLPAGDEKMTGPEDQKAKLEGTDGTAFYRPPNNFLLGGSTVEGKAIDVAVTLGGHEVLIKPFILRRPPLLLIHGLIGSPGTFADETWKSNVAPLNTVIRRVDYSSTNTKGFEENYRTLKNNIDSVLADYRAGRTPESKAYNGMNFAATRVDVTAHSMGGMITKWFVADFGNGKQGVSRGEGYDVFGTAKASYYRYLRDDNYGAGSIRRFFSLGTPFLGSPIANLVKPILAGKESNFDVWEAANLLKFPMPKLLFVNGDSQNYILPTALADMAEGSAAIQELAAASYPTGRKAISWRPLVGIATTDPNNANIGDSPDLLFNLLINLPLKLNGKVSPLGAQTSDLIVPENSQRNGGGFPSDVFQFHTHASLEGAGWQAEGSSVNMAAAIAELLAKSPSVTDFHPLRGVEQ